MTWLSLRWTYLYGGAIECTSYKDMLGAKVEIKGNLHSSIIFALTGCNFSAATAARCVRNPAVKRLFKESRRLLGNGTKSSIGSLRKSGATC